jgi:hypothetical protein
VVLQFIVEPLNLAVTVSLLLEQFVVRDALFLNSFDFVFQPKILVFGFFNFFADFLENLIQVFPKSDQPVNDRV